MFTDIPPQLIEDILKGEVVLFLGAGASYGAVHPNREKIPLGDALRDLLVKKFLNDEYRSDSLAHVAEIAIDNTDLFRVQDYVKEVFDPYGPADFHKIISLFKWKAIFTVNYDLIIEKIYETDVASKPQRLYPIVHNVPIDRISPDQLPYFKLHGCIRSHQRADLPLVLSLDQYATVHNERNRLFEKLETLAESFSVLFVGFSNSDSDIREVFNRLGQRSITRPRFYIVGNRIRHMECQSLENRRITPIILDFEAFLNKLNSSVTETNRTLSSSLSIDISHPIQRKVQSGQTISHSIFQLLTDTYEYVNQNMVSEASDPKDFYRGHFRNWDPILKNLDVKRQIGDSIVLGLADEESNQDPSLVLIKGNAGSGKSVLLKRVAWELSGSFDKLCFFNKKNIMILPDNMIEIYRICGERIYFFFDDIIHFADEIVELLERLKKSKIPVTIVGAVRTNELNVDGAKLKDVASATYELEYLVDKEIRELIALLDRYKSLGYLTNKSASEQFDAFQKRSGRELLVALYEATEGKTFSQIIGDEYDSIRDIEAKSIYLTICVLERIGCKPRAGFISRMHNVNFKDFKQRLFAPLDKIVFDEYNSRINDWEYSSRHQQIAEMVFENALKTEDTRFDEYQRIISNLDVDYFGDRTAFKAMTNTRKLRELFRNRDNIQYLLSTAEESAPADYILMQQRGIFEMNVHPRNFSLAAKYLQEASRLSHNNPVISHSLAELQLKRAEMVSDKTQKEYYLKKSQDICEAILRSGHRDSRFHHTLIKINLRRMTMLMDSSDPIVLERQIQDTQRILIKALNEHGDEPFILESESQFRSFLNDSPAALDSLVRAFDKNKKNPYISLRLSGYYETILRFEDALNVIAENLKLEPFNKDLHLRAGLLNLKYKLGDSNVILYHLKKSFTPNDSNHFAQYQCARAHFIFNQFPESRTLFDGLRGFQLSHDYVKKTRDYIINDEQQLMAYEGNIVAKNGKNCTIQLDGTGERIYGKLESWRSGASNRVRFNIAFNYFGPLALNIK